MKKTKITIQSYQKKIDKIIVKKLSVEDTLIAMLEEAARYEIIESRKD